MLIKVVRYSYYFLFISLIVIILLFAFNTMGNIDKLKNSITIMMCVIVFLLQAILYNWLRKVDNPIAAIVIVVVNISMPFFLYGM